MDARAAQRPLRTMRIHDENQAPASLVLPGKTIHQRNKSSPALTTVTQNGVVKAGVKRQAFADVSNVVRPLQVTRDDTALRGKNVVEPVKEVKQQDNKPSQLLRPAQRPLSVAGLKGFLNNLTSSNPKPVNVEVQEAAAPLANTARPTIAKRTTTVFREDDQPMPVSQREPLVQQRPAATNIISRTVSTFSQKQPVEQVQQVQKVATYEPRMDVAPQVQLPEYHDLRSDGVGLYDSNLLPEIHTDPSFFEPLDIYEDAAAHLVPEPELVHPTAQQQQQHIPAPVESHHLLPVSELEGYWEEEGYDEQYDEEGYTTARSLRSKGDYTTGGTTVVLAPRITAKVEQELAEARDVMFQVKSANEQEDDESWDTSMVAEYGDEIFDYMRKLEDRMKPNPYYMDNQTEVQWSMRSVLMDWLVQVHHRFNLLPETLFLCVNYVDRFLSCKVVSLGKLQLVGATAIFVAAKYEEINCPSINEIVYMVDGGYSVEEILKAERFMLSMLQFELGWPGPMSFLRRISKADDYDLETRTLAKYFLEITIMDERFVGCVPSYTAAGAHCLARLMLNKGTWSHAHVYYSGYTYSQLRPIIAAMLSCCEEPQQHHGAIYEKYADKRFRRASTFVETIMRKGFALPSAARPSLPSNDLELIRARADNTFRKQVEVYA